MKIKKFITTTLAATIFIISSLTVFAGTIPRINVNGHKILVKDSPFEESGRTYVPLRTVSENLGAKVHYDASADTVTVSQGNKNIVQKIGSKTAKVNGKEIQLDASAKKKGGVTYVPLRFVGENLGAEVKFDSKKNVIDIAYEMPTDEGQKYDLFGRRIRTTNLPKNAALYSYILEGVPNDMYEMQTTWQKMTWYVDPVEGKDFAKPKDVHNEEVYSEQNLTLWKDVLERNLEKRLNFSYKTVDSKWIEELVNTRFKGREDVYRGEINRYVKYAKDNRLEIEGDFFLEPSMTYHTKGIYMRTWVKFRIKSDKVKTAKLYEEYETYVNTNTWYEGYVDLELGTNNIGTDGSDYRVCGDTIVATGIIKPVRN